jgi:hypothetical protein
MLRHPAAHQPNLTPHLPIFLTLMAFPPFLILRPHGRLLGVRSTGYNEWGGADPTHPLESSSKMLRHPAALQPNLTPHLPIFLTLMALPPFLILRPHGRLWGVKSGRE